MTMAVIDGIGGGIGAQIVEHLRGENIRDASILALGANAVAAQRMVDAGADIGIALPDAMMGEVTPDIAEAVFSARGKKLLPPLSQPHVVFVGMVQKNVNDLIADAIAALRRSVPESD